MTDDETSRLVRLASEALHAHRSTLKAPPESREQRVGTNDDDATERLRYSILALGAEPADQKR